jgi:hypothetical protein
LVYARFGNRILARFHKTPSASVSEGTPVVADASAQNVVTNPAPAADPLELKVQTSKAVILTIVADGNTVFNHLVETGEAKQFEARETLEVTASDSGGVVLELNGQSVPAFGQPGVPGSIKLTRNDLKAPSGDSH